MGVYPDGSSKRLEKHTVQTRTGGSVLVAGFAVNKAKTKILIEGARANVRFDNARPIALEINFALASYLSLDSFSVERIVSDSIF